MLSAQSWTSTYHATSKHFQEYSGMVVVEKKTQEPFTQLLVSWNADMPKQGFFRFYLEVFNEKNKNWSLYKMYEWGPGVNRSFSEKNKQVGSEYAHVRFEGALGKLYRKFKIKIEAVDGAELSALRRVAVCASNMSQFKTEAVGSLQNMYFKNKYIYLSDVPCISQHDERFPESVGWCSPASLAQVIEYYTQQKIDLPALAQAVYDEKLDAYGSWPFSTAQAGVYMPNKTCYVSRLNSVKNLLKLVSHGYPVIVSICCTKPLPGAPKAYDKGHLITVVGFDLKNKTIICHDTAEKNREDIVKHYPLEPFVRAWERRQRLAYIIMPTSLVDQHL
ncbi:MAG: C39 family peptidase [Candidatus Babeliaceae bacterium]|nr:C39 family peptidase [Candidatus Babeliaceae bacterium]